MTLVQMTYFYQAATLQHFSQAAELLNISEPTLSRAINALETEFGIRLFEKKGRNVFLTKAGEIFLDQVTGILESVERTEKEMHQLASNGGHIDIAYVAPLARTYIPKTARAFLSREDNKYVLLKFHQNNSHKNIDGLKKGNFDIIFGAFLQNEPDIEFVPIIQQEIVVIMPLSHPLAVQKEITPEVFGMYPVLSYDRTSALGKITQNYFHEHDLVPEIVCESPDENAIASLVEEGFGIALVADVETIHRKGIAIRSLSSTKTISHTVYMAYMKSKYQIPAVKRFVEFVKMQK